MPCRKISTAVFTIISELICCVSGCGKTCEKIRDEGTNETARCRSWVHRFQYASRHLLYQIAR